MTWFQVFLPLVLTRSVSITYAASLTGKTGGSHDGQHQAQRGYRDDTVHRMMRSEGKAVAPHHHSHHSHHHPETDEESDQPPPASLVEGGASEDEHHRQHHHHPKCHATAVRQSLAEGTEPGEDDASDETKGGGKAEVEGEAKGEDEGEAKGEGEHEETADVSQEVGSLMEVDTDDGFSSSSVATQMTSPNTGRLETAGRWKPCGQQFGPSVYFIRGGLCLLSGCLRGDIKIDGHTLFVLPEICRPKTRTIRRVKAGRWGYEFGNIQVFPNGATLVIGDDWSGDVSLAGVVFPARSAYQSQFTTYESMYRRRRTFGDHNHVRDPQPSDPKLWNRPMSDFMPSFSLTGSICALHGFIYDLVRLNLPESCLPNDVLWFLQGTQDESQRKSVFVLPAPIGQVRPHPDDEGGHFMSLSGIIFPATPDKLTNIELVGTWGPFAAYTHPTAYLNDDVCVLQGLIEGYGAGVRAAILPFFCRPPYGMNFATTDTEKSRQVHISMEGDLHVDLAGIVSLSGIAFKAMSLDMGGRQGSPGLPGADGADGDPGKWGPPGATGEAGPQGRPGHEGYEGVHGDPGNTGEYGEPAKPTVMSTMVSPFTNMFSR